jgi:SAM-dependent methyltransferase
MDAEYAAAYAELYRNHWWWRAREEILLRKIRRVLFGASPARILDVGCGAALFFDALQQSGHVEGIESDRAAVEGSGKWRSRIVVGELDDSYKPEAPFDLILLLDLLEHVHNPDQVLRRAAEIVKSSGHILITVPAFTWLWTAHDDMNHHLRRYTAREMRSAIVRAGLITVETGYMFQSLVVTKLLVRAREALTSRSPRVPGIPPPLLNSAVHAWFRAEYSLAGWLPFGGSLLAIAAPSSCREVTEPPLFA